MCTHDTGYLGSQKHRFGSKDSRPVSLVAQTSSHETLYVCVVSCLFIAASARPALKNHDGTRGKSNKGAKAREIARQTKDSPPPAGGPTTPRAATLGACVLAVVCLVSSAPLVRLNNGRMPHPVLRAARLSPLTEAAAGKHVMNEKLSRHLIRLPPAQCEIGRMLAEPEICSAGYYIRRLWAKLSHTFGSRFTASWPLRCQGTDIRQGVSLMSERPLDWSSCFP